MSKNLYTPDRWVVFDVEIPNKEKIKKVMGGWYGGFAGSDSWRINSGVANVTEYNDYYEFEGYSGSVYRCYKNSYGFTGLSRAVFDSLKEQAKDQNATITIDETYTQVGSDLN